MYVSEMIVARSLVLLPVKSPCIPSWRPFEGSETGDNVSLCVFNISSSSLAGTLHMILHWTVIGQTGFYRDPSSLGFTSIFDSDHHHYHCLSMPIVWTVSQHVLYCTRDQFRLVHSSIEICDVDTQLSKAFLTFCCVYYLRMSIIYLTRSSVIETHGNISYLEWTSLIPSMCCVLCCGSTCGKYSVRQHCRVNTEDTAQYLNNNRTRSYIGDRIIEKLSKFQNSLIPLYVRKHDAVGTWKLVWGHTTIKLKFALVKCGW